MRRIYWYLSLVALVSFGLITETADDFFEISKNMEIYGKVYTEVNRIYVDDVNPGRLMRTGIEAMLASLDPYTNYYSESQIEASRLYNSGQYSGIGAEMVIRGEKIIISELFQSGPADQAGIKVGDEVLKIDEESLSGSQFDLEDIQNLILGENKTPVRLTIRRVGETVPQEVSILRGGATVQQQNVPYAGMADSVTGYIMLTGFMQDAGLEVAQALTRLKKEHPGLRGVILDLRGNPGGRLDEAVNVVNVFIPQNERTVEMHGRSRESNNIFHSTQQPVDSKIPVAVLLNGRSASASEVVAGAIQDMDRGVIVGQRSFGKGLVQNVRPLSHNTQMKITVAKYYTPSGRCIQAIDYGNRYADGRAGRIPDSLVKAFKTRNGRIVYDGGGISPDIEVPIPAQPPIVAALEAQNLIFDFVTQYASSHDSLPGGRAFEVGDAAYEDFRAFLKVRGFLYQTPLELQLARLRIKADSLADPVLLARVADLEKALSREKQDEVTLQKPYLTTLLRRELVNRYYYKQGALEASFDQDADIREARRILADPTSYQALLAPPK
ncbi:MAG: S41 family peptidase [Bacteroidia bacterium]|nr:S41 family peptidase [Bacteroidia bacterium]